MLKDTYVTHCNCCPLKFDRGSLQDLNREKLRQGNQKVFELNAEQDKEWFGRSQDMCKFYKSLVKDKKRFITIHGQENLGKRYIANQLCLYIQERDIFLNGVVGVKDLDQDCDKSLASRIIQRLYKSLKDQCYKIREVPPDVEHFEISESMRREFSKQDICNLSKICKFLKDKNLLILVEKMPIDKMESQLSKQVLEQIHRCCEQVRFLVTS